MFFWLSYFLSTAPKRLPWDQNKLMGMMWKKKKILYWIYRPMLIRSIILTEVSKHFNGTEKMFNKLNICIKMHMYIGNTGGWTQGLAFDRQVFYQLSYTSPVKNILTSGYLYEIDMRTPNTYFIPYIKINPKWVIDLNVKTKTKTNLEGNYLHNLQRLHRKQEV
jgi:hypothetical protein